MKALQQVASIGQSSKLYFLIELADREVGTISEIEIHTTQPKVALLEARKRCPRNKKVIAMHDSDGFTYYTHGPLTAQLDLERTVL